MRRKSLLTMATCLMTVFLSGAIYACSNTGSPSSEPTPDSSETIETRAYWIKLNQDDLELLVDESFSLSAQLYLGASVVSDATFTWESANPSVSTVSSNGYVMAVAEGETEIVVKANGYENVEYSVSVSVNPLLTLDLSKQEIELAKKVWEGYETSAEVEYEVKWNNQIVNDATITVSSSNENVIATLNGKKIVVTAKEIGDSVITAKFVKEGKTVETYLNVSVVKPYLKSDEIYLFSTGRKNTLDISLIEEAKEVSAESVISVSADGKEFPIVEATGSVLKLSDTSSLGFDGSITTQVVIECEEVRIGVDVKGYTHVIRTAKDFDDMKYFLEDTALTAATQSGLLYCKTIKGYYILANDIDFAEEYPNGYASPFSYPDVGYKNNGDTHAWKATFDGNGHVISGVKIIKSTTPAGTWNNSLFGTISGGGGVVKNVAFTECEVDAALYGSAFLANFVYGKVENVFLDVKVNTNTENKSAKYGNSAFVGMANDEGLKSTWNETSISNVTVVIRDSLGGYDYMAKGTIAGFESSVKGSFVTIGGGNEAKIVQNYATISEVKEANSNVKAYTSTIEAAKDKSLIQCGSTTFASNNGTFTVYWNGEAIYTSVAEVLYSIDDATIDFEKIGITIDGNTKISRNGTDVAFTLNGQVAKISGDAVLNNTNPQSATGAINTLTVSTSTATYNIPLKVCTDILYTAKDFDDMKRFLVDTTDTANTKLSFDYCKKITGYYVLGADIDFSRDYANGYTSPFSYWDIGGKVTGYAYGWKATFDGNGHTISNLKLIASTTVGGTWQNSLFGIIAADNADGNQGVVKNVAFKNCSLADNLYNSAFLANIVYGTVENVYLEVRLTTNHTSTSGNAVFVGMDNGRGVESTDSKTSISNVTIVVGGLGANDYVMKGKTAGVPCIKGSVVVIGATESKVFEGYTTLTDLTTANGNIKAYINIEKASQDDTLTACGSTVFATNNDKFMIFWDEKEVYSQTLMS